MPKEFDRLRDGKPIGSGRVDQRGGSCARDLEEAIKGVVEGVKGKAKEVGGALAGRNDLIEEGKAQQDKADAQRGAAKKEAEADAARAGAKAAEERQKQHQ